MSAKQIQQIFSYIQSNGNFLSSQKVLKQIQKHPEIVWQLIVKLCSKLKNKNIQNAYAQIVYMLNDPEKHERSSKWLKQYMDIRDLSIKLGTRYAVMDYIKPEKDKIINLIYKIIDISKGVKKIKDDLDQLIVREQQMNKEMNRFRLQEESTKITLEELKERKSNQKPLFDEKVGLCSRINQDINSKRQQKFDQISKQISLKEELTQKMKKLQEKKYQNQNQSIKIEQLKKQIAKNAPEVKKEKRAIEDEYHKFQKQVHVELESKKYRQSKIKQFLQARDIYKNYIIDLANKLVEIFTIFDQKKSKNTKGKNENEEFKRRILLQMTLQSQIKDRIHQVQMQTFNQSAMHDNLIRLRQRIQMNFRQLVAKVTDKKEDIRSVSERQKKFKRLNDSVIEEIENIKQKHQERIKDLQNQKKRWDQKVMKSLIQIYSPLNQLKFE